MSDSVNQTLEEVMNTQMLLWSIIFAILIIAVIALVWAAVGALIEGRRKKRSKKAHEDWEREQAERAPESEPEQEDLGAVMYLRLSKKADYDIRLVQLRTKVESPQLVLCHAMLLYAALVESYSNGYKLFLGKPSETVATRVLFPPLERVEKKIES